MAFPAPAPFFIDENQQINRGEIAFLSKTNLWKRIFPEIDTPFWSACSGKKADAPRAKGPKLSENPERRALQDLSNFAKVTGSKDTSNLKERSQQKPFHNMTNTIKGTALKDRSTQKQRSEALKNPVKIFVDEETKMCHEWAKDGVEGFHSTQNDSQKSDKDLLDKRMIALLGS